MGTKHIIFKIKRYFKILKILIKAEVVRTLMTVVSPELTFVGSMFDRRSDINTRVTSKSIKQ